MREFIYFFASGAGFAIGMGMFFTAIAISFVPRLWAVIGRYVLVIGGAIVIFLSATPLSNWLYLVWMLVIVTWLVIEHLWPRLDRRRTIVRYCALALCAWIGTSELLRARIPEIPAWQYSRLYLVGDSISAGVDTPGITTWPVLLRQSHGIELVDLSRAGATTGSARKLIDSVEFKDGLVLLEIGGNDLFWSPPAEMFRSDLEAIIRKVSGAGRTVIMFELPLHPMQNYMGRIQRELAERYEVTLIPKRVLTRVLSIPNGSLDGLHLSASGHQYMADMIWDLVSPAMGK
jgi:acyl-CoA thioesterase I